MTEMDESAAPCAYTDNGRGPCPAPTVARRTPMVLAPRQVARRALVLVHHPKIRRKKGDESAAGCRARIPTRRHAEHYRVHAPFIPWHAEHRRGCLRLIRGGKNAMSREQDAEPAIADTGAFRTLPSAGPFKPWHAEHRRECMRLITWHAEHYRVLVPNLSDHNQRDTE